GVDPGPSLQQLYQDILNADAASSAGPARARAATPAGPAQPAPAQLPADISDFTGRAGQVEELHRLLSPDGQAPGSPGAVPVVLVGGSGGLGETALAGHVAHLLRAQLGGRP